MRETDNINGTQVQAIIEGLDAVYSLLAEAQSAWKVVSPWNCPDGCGTCCVGFEPDVLECEALYLAAWMLHHQRDRAEALVEGRFAAIGGATSETCVLFDPNSPSHCTVYGGRCLICRLFGYSGDRGKDGEPRFRPCKFLPEDESSAGRRQYSIEELSAIFGAVPPVMSDIAAQALALSPDSAEERLPLREALPRAIAKIRMLERFSGMPTDPETPEPNPSSPMPRAS
ncbi:MAG TPA: YkgJ family cysteine cluster protein [Treponemataceae bacterium]|nr:YkgJ family cysteine cluster protein [Treponemataceae bacterium]